MKKIIYLIIKNLIRVFRWVQKFFFDNIVLLSLKYVHFKDNKILEYFGRKLNAIKFLFLEIYFLLKKTFNINIKKEYFYLENLIKKVENLEKFVDCVNNDIKRYGLYYSIFIYKNKIIVIFKNNIRKFFEVIKSILLENRILLKYFKIFNNFLENSLLYKNFYFMLIYIFFFILFFFYKWNIIYIILYYIFFVSIIEIINSYFLYQKFFENENDIETYNYIKFISKIIKLVLLIIFFSLSFKDIYNNIIYGIFEGFFFIDMFINIGQNLVRFIESFILILNKIVDLIIKIILHDYIKDLNFCMKFFKELFEVYFIFIYCLIRDNTPWSIIVEMNGMVINVIYFFWEKIVSNSYFAPFAFLYHYIYNVCILKQSCSIVEFYHEILLEHSCDLFKKINKCILENIYYYIYLNLYEFYYPLIQLFNFEDGVSIILKFYKFFCEVIRLIFCRIYDIFFNIIKIFSLMLDLVFKGGN